MQVRMLNFDSLLTISVAGIVLVMVVGGLLPIFLPREGKHLPHTLSVAAGIMLAAGCVHLLPEAFESIGEGVGLATLAGFVTLYFFERFVTVHICEARDCHVHTVGVSALFGLSLHTFANGVALGAGMLEGVGGMVFLAIAVHKLPEAFCLSSILIHEKYDRWKIVAMNALFVSMIPLGALAVKLVSSITTINFAGWALAFSAGTFIHIALTDLLPEVHKHAERRLATTASFLLGIILVLVMGLLRHH